MATRELTPQMMKMFNSTQREFMFFNQSPTNIEPILTSQDQELLSMISKMDSGDKR